MRFQRHKRMPPTRPIAMPRNLQPLNHNPLRARQQEIPQIRPCRRMRQARNDDLPGLRLDHLFAHRAHGVFGAGSIVRAARHASWRRWASIRVCRRLVVRGNGHV